MIELKDNQLKDLGVDGRRVGILSMADQRCLETQVNPCGICRIQDMVSLTPDVSVAQAIAEICCPSGKIPACLERKLAAMPVSA